MGVIGWGEITDQARETSIGLLHRWLALRRAGDFETADRLKTDAMRLGVELRAQKSPNGVTGGLAKLADRVDVSALEGLL